VNRDRAGVLNFGFRDNPSGIEVTSRFGQYFPGHGFPNDGWDRTVAANIGLPLGSQGFFNVSVNAYKEWQNDGFAAQGVGNGLNLSGKVDFDPTWAIEALYVQPLAFQPLPLTFKSFAVIHGPKGCGEPCGPVGPGLKRTTEYLTQQTLLLDVGKLAWGKPDQFAVWTAYRWWKNKFGIDPNQPGFSFPFTVESTWLTGATWTF